ncbi:hypothetical protein BV25DRAFT_1835722 [Artomyces pyxidatus]|uniref:Uncharacterized protein n=1 Tax=Artomyces pyxidatus TaxID=48021 RepID=A0ACB8TEA1_9AGAM|nr:hypothetical protein BV25DRAFT_1835722 [Artomyces pyxidatus]
MGRRRSQATAPKNVDVPVGPVDPGDDVDVPRQTRRSKRVREEAAAQEEINAPDAGVSKKRTRGQPQKKAKQAQGAHLQAPTPHSSRQPSSGPTPAPAEATRRKRANTSELQPETIKKSKAKAHQAAPVHEWDQSDASASMPGATGRGRRLRKRQGSPTASTDVADALDVLQVSDVEEAQHGEENGSEEESGTGSDSESSKSTSEGDEEEGSEKFGESGGSGAEHEHTGEGVMKKGKGKSRSNAGEQLSIAIPAFEKARSRGKGAAAGDAESNGFSSVSGRKGAQAVTSNERPVAPTSDSDSDDPNKTKWPALPRRVKPRPITSTSNASAPSNNPQEDEGPRQAHVTSGESTTSRTSAAAEAPTAGQRTTVSLPPSQHSRGVRSKATKSHAEDARAQFIASARKNAVVAACSAPAGSSKKKTKRAPAGRGAGQAGGAFWEQPEEGEDELAAGNKDVDAAGSGLDENTEELVREEAAEAFPLNEAELDDDDDEQKPNVQQEAAPAAAPANTPLDIELRPVDGGKIGIMAIQMAPVKAVLKEANTIQIHRVLCWSHFMATDLTYRDELVREALIAAAKKLGQRQVEERLREDLQYATRLGAIPRDRMSSTRNEIKGRISRAIAVNYQFAKYGTKAKLAQGVAHITEAPIYRYIFPGDHIVRPATTRHLLPQILLTKLQTSNYDKTALFCHEAIINSMRETYFKKKRLPEKWYSSSITQGEEASELELPAPMVVFHAVATLACLKDYQTGSFISLPFLTADGDDEKAGASYGEAYKDHMTTLLNLKRTNLTAYHTLMHYLYMAVSGLVMEDDHADPSSGAAGISNPEVDLANVGANLKLRRRN